jgi:hypothetical protein
MNRELLSEVDSLKNSNDILRDHMNYLRRKLREKEEMLEACIENIENLKKLNQVSNKENIFKISLN